jgi:hypothetical protein
MSNELNVKFTRLVEPIDAVFDIYDLFGRKVLSRFSKVKTEQIKLETDVLPPGTYFLNILSEDRTRTYIIFKQF